MMHIDELIDVVDNMRPTSSKNSVRIMSGYGKADALAAGSRSRTVIRRGCPLSAEQPKIFAHVEFFSV
jgi:hypothetical protein